MAETFIDSPGLESANVETSKPVETELTDSPMEIETEGETPEVESQESESSEGETGEDAPESTPEADAAPKPDKAVKGVQKRIDEITRQRYEAQRDRDYWRNKALQDAARQQAPQGANTVQADTAQFGPPPTLAQFGYDEAKFNAALTDYNQKLFTQTVPAMVSRSIQEHLSRSEQQRQQAAAEERAMQFQSKEAKVAEKYADYEAVAHNPDLPISPVMADAIQTSQSGPEIAYYLGSNPQEAARIFALSPLEQALQIGRIEANFSRPAPRKTTNAPDPVSPVGSNKVVKKSPEKMSTAEYREWRSKQK